MSQVTETTPRPGTAARARQLGRRLNTLGGLVPHDLIALAARVFPAMVFWQSARTKVEGFSIKEQTFFLFEHVYALPLIPPAWAAVLATIAEHILPVLLVLGLMSRLSALGLLIMTAVIQIFVFPGAWVTHGLWAVALLVVVAQGPGRLSLDHLFGLDRGRRQP
ncbi:DoxX family protein [Rhodobaculum claviforme]|uniref:DoxX family protein n=1 Tax=Rhodobaculum claviforme TaxID=1549854 RepID=A0A934TM86_9RHOB|nr:DoxX family protein [Rhodobaculum claviforme]MBK5928061.1 DoxX family protein [Rhodobaculum claviforme]